MKRILSAKMGFVLALLVGLLLVGLPLAVWLDLSNLVDTNLRRQAGDLNSIISSIRRLLCHQCGRSHPGFARNDQGRT